MTGTISGVAMSLAAEIPGEASLPEGEDLLGLLPDEEPRTAVLEKNLPHDDFAADIGQGKITGPGLRFPVRHETVSRLQVPGPGCFGGNLPDRDGTPREP